MWHVMACCWSPMAPESAYDAWPIALNQAIDLLILLLSKLPGLGAKGSANVGNWFAERHNSTILEDARTYAILDCSYAYAKFHYFEESTLVPYQAQLYETDGNW